MKKLYAVLWWFWPLIFVIIGVAQDRLGRNVFGYWVIPISLMTVLGSFLTGILGSTLYFQQHKSWWMLATVVVAFTPCVDYLFLLFT